MALVLKPGGALPVGPAATARALPARLESLAGRRKRAALVSALTRWLALAVALALAIGLADALLRIGDPARAGLLVLTLAGLTGLFRRAVTPAWRMPVSAGAAARLLEDRFPRLGDSVASAADFLAHPRPGAARFRQVAVVRAANALRRVDPEAIVPAREARRGLMLFFVALGTLGAVAIWDAPEVRAAFLRLADPLGSHRYPTKTTVEMVTPASRLARGEPYPVTLRLGGVRPDLVTLEIRPLDGSSGADESVPVPQGDAEADLPAAVDTGRVARDFRIRALAGDGESDWHTVTVAPAPRLVPRAGRASPQVRVEAPDYTRLPPVQLPDGAGVVETVAGSRIILSASADSRIVRASLSPQADRAADRAALAAAATGPPSPLGALAAQLLADGILADIPVAVSGPGGTDLDADFIPYTPGLYVFRFEDETGLAGTRLFDFRLAPDPAPVVTLARPDSSRDPLSLLPGAELPVEARAVDRLFAVRDLVLEYRVGGGDWRGLSLAEWSPDATHAALGGGVVPHLPRPQTLTAVRRVPIASLTRPDGTPPADGDLVTVRAASRDFDTRTAIKEPGRSREVELRILSASALEASFQKDLAALRPELLRLKEQLREAADRVREEAQRPAPDPATLAQAEQAQRQARNQVASAQTGLRDRLDRLRRTAEANRLPASATTAKLNRVARGLDRLADGQLDAAEAAVAAAKLATGTPADAPGGKPEMNPLLAEAQRKQDAARRTVDDALATLEEWGGAGEIRGAARGLQEQVQRAAEPDSRPGPASERAASRLTQAAEGSAELLTRAGRLAQEKDSQAEAAAEKGDKAGAELARAEAKALREGVTAAGGDALTGDLRKAAEATREGRTAGAEQARRSALERLEKLAAPLAAPPPKAGDDQAALAEEVEKLAEDQALLRKKAKKAAAEPDPAQRADQLARLAVEQETLRRKAEQLAERLTRERPAAADELRRAATAQDAARDRLERGEAGTPDQEAALDRLDGAKDKLADAPPPPEQLGREKREQLAQKLSALRDEQKAALAECDRIQASLIEAKAWDRPLLITVRDLADRETQFATLARAFAAENLAQLVVFAKLLDQSATAADQSAERLTRRADEADPASALDPFGEAVQHRKAREPLARSLTRLELLVAAIKPDEKKPPKPDEKKPEGEPQGGQKGEEQPQPPESGGLPPLAELKALRALQAEVATRTRELAEQYPPGKKLPPDAKVELADLEQAQRDIAGLFAQVADRMTKPPGGSP